MPNNCSSPGLSSSPSRRPSIFGPPISSSPKLARSPSPPEPSPPEPSPPEPSPTPPLPPAPLNPLVPLLPSPLLSPSGFKDRPSGPYCTSSAENQGLPNSSNGDHAVISSANCPNGERRLITPSGSPKSFRALPFSLQLGISLAVKNTLPPVPAPGLLNVPNTSLGSAPTCLRLISYCIGTPLSKSLGNILYMPLSITCISVMPPSASTPVIINLAGFSTATCSLSFADTCASLPCPLTVIVGGLSML